MSSYIEIRNVVKSFGNNTVLKHINLDVNEGEMVTLLGPSGWPLLRWRWGMIWSRASRNKTPIQRVTCCRNVSAIMIFSFLWPSRRSGRAASPGR